MKIPKMFCQKPILNQVAAKNIYSDWCALSYPYHHCLNFCFANFCAVFGKFFYGLSNIVWSDLMKNCVWNETSIS